MLNWFGAPQGRNGDTDDTSMPETPAPLFAARAIKSAFFGTPNPNDETIIPSQEIRPSGPRHEVTGVKDHKPQRLAESPTKPQGILMTPGTAGARRKTVSFGAGILDNEGRQKKAGLGKSGLPNDCPGKFPSPWTPKVSGGELPPPMRATNLNRILQESRESGKRKASGDRKSDFTEELENHGDIEDMRKGDVGLPASEAQTNLQAKIAEVQDTLRAAHNDGDMTFDLNKPHSQSGQYWKSEYERYHQEAKEEMRKLLKYKQLAKSYAKKKDGEALDLGERLREEKQKVARMEQKLSQLAAQVASRGHDDDDSPGLMRDLARQTALTVQYKDEVARFQSALQERAERDEADLFDPKSTSPRTAQTLLEVSQELKKSREQLKEMAGLRSEVHNLKLSLSTAERKADKLNEDNAKLAKDFQRVRADLEQSEKRRKEAEEYADGMEKKYDDMKHLAKNKRVEAEALLKKSHDEKVSLRKEIRALKRQKGSINLNAQPEVSKSTRDTNDEADDLNFTTRRRSYDADKPVKSGAEPLDSGRTMRPSSYHHGESKLLLKSHGDEVPRRVTVQRSMPLPAIPDTKSKTAPRVLSEIVNNSSSPKPVATQGSTPNSFKRLSEISIESPGFSLPTPEPLPIHVAVSKATASRRTKPSPGPSMFNIPSSPPRPAAARSRSTDTSRGRDVANNGKMSPDGTPRKILTEERAAAAKARLEQRNAEKKRMQELPALLKENAAPRA